MLDGVLTASVKAGVTPLKHIIIRPTYFDPITMTTQTGDPIPEGDLAPGEEHKGIPLPRHEILAPFRSLVATDYTVDATGSPLTETTLAFLGTEDGSPAELPLAEFTELFGFTEFVVPLLRAADNMTNLFIGVDLTQWLSDPRPFAVGDVFSFVNGVDPDLPGFLVGTSPISFSSEFITNTYTGDTVVVASIDGTVVPEPGSALLLLTGLIGLRLLGAGRGRFSCSRASEYSAKHYAIGANQGARKSCANFGAPAIAGGG